MSSLSLLLNAEASATSPPIPPSQPPPEGSPSSFSGSALDFLAEAAVSGNFGGGEGGGDRSPPVGVDGLDAMEGVEAGGSSKVESSPKYQLDPSFFPAAPDGSFLPPPDRSPFSHSPSSGQLPKLAASPSAVMLGLSGDPPPLSFDFAAASAAGGGPHVSTEHPDIPAHLLSWGDEPLSAAERVKIGRRKVPAPPAPPPAPPPAAHPRPSVQTQQAPPVSNPVSTPSRPVASISSLFTLPVLAPPPAASAPPPPPPPAMIPTVVVPKKERKTSQVPPANPVTSPSNGFYPPGTVGARPAFPLTDRPASMVSDQGGYPPLSGGSESGTSSNPGSSVPPQQQQQPYQQPHQQPFGEPVLKPGGRKRVLGPDGKPVKKVKVPGRGQAWRKGLGGVGTGSAAPKLSTPLELFTAPSGPPRPKKPKKPKMAEDGSVSASESASGSAVPMAEYSVPVQSNGAAPSHPVQQEKQPKVAKAKVSKPGTHPKKAMPKFGPELPPNWVPTNLPIAQRPRDPTPPAPLPAVEEEDNSLYCICETKYDEEKPMIACDKCEEWYHPECVGISDEKIELVDIFICPKCFDLTEQRTTWKAKCKSQGCYKPCVPPLTKYCSSACGVKHLTEVASAQAAPLVSMLPRLSNTRRPGGVTVVEPVPSTLSSPSSNQPSEPPSPEADKPNPLLLTLQTTLSTLDKDIDEQSIKLGLIDKRLELLAKADERSERIEQRKQREKKDKEDRDRAAANGDGSLKTEDGAEEATDKPAIIKPAAKGKKADASAKDSPDRECGFDRRLVLGEREFGDWCESEDGQRTLSGSDEDEDHSREGQSGGAMDGARWWCEETRKKCDGHAGWQKWRKVDFEMERDQKRDRVNKLKRKQALVQKELGQLEAEADARSKLAAAKVAQQQQQQQQQQQLQSAQKPVSGGDSVRVVSMPSSLLNPFARGVSSVGSGEPLSNGVTSFASFGSVGGGGPVSGGYSNERGGYSNERGGEGTEDVEMA